MSQTEETVISPKGSTPILKSLLKHKELVYFFTWRELKVRYKQAALGVIWVIIQPALFMLLVNFIIVQRIGISFGDGSVPSFLLIFLGFTLWQLFEPSLSYATNSFINNQELFKKLYFPRVIPTISFMLSRLIDFFIAFGLLFVVSLMIGHVMPPVTLLMVVPGIIMLLLTVYGAGLFLGSLNMKYRDIQQLVPFFMRILFFATPIIWPFSIIPQNIQAIFYLNPATAVIESMRKSWYNVHDIQWELLIYPLITMTLFLVIGVWTYKRREKDMVDVA